MDIEKVKEVMRIQGVDGSMYDTELEEFDIGVENIKCSIGDDKVHCDMTNWEGMLPDVRGNDVDKVVFIGEDDYRSTVVPDHEHYDIFYEGSFSCGRVSQEVVDEEFEGYSEDDILVCHSD